MNWTQEQYQRVWSFASFINEKFVEKYGKEGSCNPEFVKRTKINCFLNGLRPEIRNLLRYDIKNYQQSNLTWDQVVEGAHDAEWLKDLHTAKVFACEVHRQEANRDSGSSEPDYYDNQDDFDIDEEGFVHVYTDGACSNNGTSKAVAGIGVWFGDRHHQNESRPIDPKRHPATNMVAEIMAVTEAFDTARIMGAERLAVHTDSMLIVDCFQKRWIHTWLANGWIKANGRPVENKKQFRELLSSLQDFVAFKLIHVNRNSGVEGNVQADKLAKQGKLKPLMGKYMK